MKRYLDWAAQLAEYGIAFLFLKGAYDIGRAEAVDTASDTLDALATREAIIVYAGLCLVLGLSLVAGKIFKLRRTHGYALAGMFLLTCYIITLSIFISGWDKGLILSIFYGLVMLALYARWRYKVIFDKLD